MYPQKLRQGNTVALISPAGAIYETEAVQIAIESLEALGLKVKLGEHLLDKVGYLAGTDANRAKDLQKAFEDTAVDGIIAMRGGYGCGRILDLLDYNAIAKNPKIFAGFSDVTALLLALYKKTGLVTFHSPMGTSVWNDFTVSHFKNMLFESEYKENTTNILQNPTQKGDNLTQTADRITTITTGKAEGIFLGGNLTVLASLIGTPYLPNFNNSILFLEEVNEEIYRIDRLFCQLKLSGILSNLRGVVLGKFTNCGHGNRFSSLTLEEIFTHYIAPLNIPAFSGTMIGHINNKFTVPVGHIVKIDAEKGSIEV